MPACVCEAVGIRSRPVLDFISLLLAHELIN